MNLHCAWSCSSSHTNRHQPLTSIVYMGKRPCRRVAVLPSPFLVVYVYIYMQTSWQFHGMSGQTSQTHNTYIYIHTSLYVPSYPHQNLMISPSFFHHIPIFVDHSPIESHPHPGNFFPLTLTTASCPLAAAKWRASERDVFFEKG